MEAAKRHEIADAEFSKNSISGLADAWSQALAVEGRRSPETTSSPSARSRSRTSTGSPGNISINDTAITAVLTPRPSGKPVVVQKVRRQGVLHPRKRQRRCPFPTGPKKPRPFPPVPPGPSPEFAVLPNGLRLILLPSTISPTVTLYGQVRNNPDMEAPKSKEGVDQVLGDLFSYGTTTLDRLAFQKALDEIAANVSAGTDFSLQVLVGPFRPGSGASGRQPAAPGPAETSLRGGPQGDGRLPRRQAEEPRLSRSSGPARGAVSQKRPGLAPGHARDVASL